MSREKIWLVYLMHTCEMGTEGYSGWSHYCIIKGDTDDEIYNKWVEVMTKENGYDYRKDFYENNGHYFCYYELGKTELPMHVYGNAKQLEIIPHSDRD